MKIKSKIILFVCAFALIFSVLSVSCFAFVSSIDIGKTYRFISYPVLSDSQGEYLEFDVSGEISLEIDGLTYTSFIVENGSLSFANDSTSWRFDELSGVWTYSDSSSTEKLDAPFFEVTFISPSIDYRFYNWFLGNITLVSDDSFYDNLYSSISSGVFGPGAVLTPEQTMTLTLISTVLSYAFILLPLLLVIGFVLRCFRL